MFTDGRRNAGDETKPLSTRIETLLEPLGGRTSVVARRATAPLEPLPVLPGTGSAAPRTRNDSRAIAIRPDEAYPAADLAHLPVALELLRRADLGQFDLAERLDTSDEPRAGGFGVLDHLDPATPLTLGDLCYLMIGINDSTAANFLLSMVGMGEVNETMSRLNLPHTRLARRFMDFVARAAHRENLTSAADMVSLLSLLRGRAVPGAARLREFLAGQQLGADVKALLPASARLAHKTGSLDGLFHDAGILSGPGGACVYCVLTAEQVSVPAARGATAAILRELWNEWCENDEPAGENLPAQHNRLEGE